MFPDSRLRCRLFTRCSAIYTPEKMIWNAGYGMDTVSTSESVPSSFADLFCLDAPSLTLRASPSQGMHIHLAKPRRDSKNLDSDNSFTKIGESASTKSYFHRVRDAPSFEASALNDTDTAHDRNGRNLGQ